MRRVLLPSGDEVILSDTVGFISDLPTELVAAFRATLEEVLDADLILHVRDISHPQSAEQARDVTAILASLGVGEGAPLIEVWNKIDKVEAEARAALEVTAARTENLFAVSALAGEGLDRLLDAVAEVLRPQRLSESLDLPHGAGRQRAWLYAQGLVQGETQTEDGARIDVLWSARQKERFSRL